MTLAITTFFGLAAAYRHNKKQSLKKPLPLRGTKKLVFEFTDDPSLKQAYYNIREEQLKNKLKLKNFSGMENDDDRAGEIIVIKSHGIVVGGARLIGSTPENRRSLPFEEDGYSLNELFPELNLSEERYCEYSRIAILPEYRNMDTLRKMVRYLNGRAKSQGYKYMFSVSPKVQHRYYRRVQRMHGYSYDIYLNMQAPAKNLYEGVKMYMAMSKLV